MVVLAFCVLVPGWQTQPDGRVALGVFNVCWGDPPGADLPEIDLTPHGADLPEQNLAETGPDLVNPIDTPAETGTDAEAQSEADVDEDICVEGCDGCTAALQGFADWTNYFPDQTEISPEDMIGQPEAMYMGYAYQAAVCGRPHDPVGGRIEEWKFVAYSWDGFEHAACRMMEAKWGYNSLLEDFYVSVNGDPRRRTAPRSGMEGLARSRFARLIAQATAQKGRISPYPEVGLLWMFAHFDSYIFFRMSGGNALAIDVEHRPG